jgi:hypothetical protein
MKPYEYLQKILEAQELGEDSEELKALRARRVRRWADNPIWRIAGQGHAYQGQLRPRPHLLLRA